LFVIGANGMGKTTTIGKIASEEHMMLYVCI
jgi:signal recognition particle GTPase